MIIFDLAQKYGRYSHYPIRAGPDVFVITDVIKSTNKQSQVLDEAFESLKLIHKKIQSYLMNVNSEEISDSVSSLLNDISKNIFNEVVETSKEKEIGNIVNVKITDAKSFSLDGKIVK